MLELVVADGVKEWVQKEIGFEVSTPVWAVGIVLNGLIIGGVLYHNYTEQNCEMTIATINKRWASRRIIKHLLSYPFDCLGCRRITAMTDINNVASISMLTRLGFQQEGVLREASPFKDGADYIIFGLLKKDYINGKIST